MRILIAHNYYQQPGGEDRVFEAELRLLQDRGHEVVPFIVHNDAIDTMSRAQLVRATLWNRDAHDRIATLIRRHRIELAHFHNTFPLISPSAYAAARSAGTAVVQTLHNFRLLCLNAVLYRDGAVCERCINKSIKWPGIVRRCYRDSLMGSGMVAAMLAVHRFVGTWRRSVDAFIAPSNSARLKLVEGGVPAMKLFVKPHFINPDPGEGAGAGGFALFVGRLSHEKGLATLLRAWQTRAPALPLKIIGDGPLAPAVREACQRDRVEWFGRRDLDELYRIMGDAAVLILPSECYETFGRVAAEAFAKGTPVIASNHGAMAEIIDHGRTGLLFRPGDPADLARQVTALASDAARLLAMRRQCRQEYLRKYTAQSNYEQLISIYERARRVGVLAHRSAPDDRAPKDTVGEYAHPTRISPRGAS